MPSLMSERDIEKILSGKWHKTRARAKGFSDDAINKFIEETREGLTLTVGIHEGAGEHEGTSLAEIAMYNEFGTRTIPARPFMRSTIDAQDAAMQKLFANNVEKMLSGKGKGKNLSVAAILELVGARLASAIQRKITSIRSPRNAKSTIKKKGSSNPLIDTGAMRQAISWRVHKGNGE